MTTMTIEHIWVKHVITPVSVLEGSEGQPVVFVDPEQQEIAEDEAVYGCNRCLNPMVTHFGTKCKGEEDDE